jgi:hypothetical protein
VRAGKILAELDKLETVLVAAAGNRGSTTPEAQGYPSKYLWSENPGYPNVDNRLDNMIIVGATDGNGRRAFFGNDPPWLTTYAP